MLTPLSPSPAPSTFTVSSEEKHLHEDLLKSIKDIIFLQCQKAELQLSDFTGKYNLAVKLLEGEREYAG